MSHRRYRRGRNWLILALAAPLALIASSIPLAAQAHAGDLPVLHDVAYGSDPLQQMDIYPVSVTAPAVIVVHGGGWRGKDKLDPPILHAAESLAADGFAVFNINFRQAGRNQPGFPIMTDDIASAAAWIQQNGAQYGADTSDINLIGGSSSGQLVALAGELMNISSPGMIHRLVSLSGPMDFVELNHPTDGTPPPGDLDHPGVDTYLGCLPSNCTPEQEQVPSPYYNIDPATCPSMLLINSVDDMLVPVSQPTRMQDAMVAAGCDSTLTIVPGADHGFELFDAQHAEITAYFRGEPLPVDLPDLSLTGATVTESVDGTADLTLTADQPADTDIRVDYATADGSAVAGADYAASAGTLTLPAGSTTATLSIPILDDAIAEPSEQFTVTLANPVGATITTGAVTVTIIDDTPAPPPTISGVTPSALGQGAVGAPVTIAGTGFTAGSTVAVSGSGVALANTTYLNAQTLTVTMTVDKAAATGQRTVTVTTPGSGTASCSCLTVNTKPTVTTSTPKQLGTGATDQVLTMTGSGFTPATVVTIVGRQGVRAVTQFVSATTLSVSVSVNQNAHVGNYNIVVTNADHGTSTCSKCFVVVAGPAPASVTPSALPSGSTTAVTIKGTNFQAGAVLILPTGVTATNVSVANSTTITAVLTVAPHRRAGAGMSLTVTNPAGCGSGSCTCLSVTK